MTGFYLSKVLSIHSIHLRSSFLNKCTKHHTILINYWLNFAFPTQFVTVYLNTSYARIFFWQFIWTLHLLQFIVSMSPMLLRIGQFWQQRQLASFCNLHITILFQFEFIHRIGEYSSGKLCNRRRLLSHFVTDFLYSFLYFIWRKNVFLFPLVLPDCFRPRKTR